MKKQLVIIGLFTLTIHLNAQGLSNTETHVYDTLVLSYLKSADLYSPLYSGREHTKYTPWVKGHPFFVSDQYSKGSVFYDGLLYPDVNLRLDLYKNELMVQSPDGRYNIVLPEEEVEWADFHSQRVISHRRGLKKESPPTGYYIQLYEGKKYTLWEKQMYEWKETIVDHRLEVEFLFKNRFYILENDRFYPVKSKASVLKLFQSKKSELNQFIKQNGLNFRHDPANAISKSVQYYESITL